MWYRLFRMFAWLADDVVQDVSNWIFWKLQDLADFCYQKAFPNEN